jgi:16S rRNA (guanine(966)-N(2))-methyltransferase RsmD
MRVIAGSYRSRILKSLKGLALRPTSDRLRETLFDVLGSSVTGSRFVDAFAGTGAVGIEALSRGASQVVFIENHPPAVVLIKKNLKSLGVRSGATVLGTGALRGLETLAAKPQPGSPPFDFVFLDPPYAAAGEYEHVLHFLGSAPILVPGSVVIAEHRKNLDLPSQFGSLISFRFLKQGDAALTFYRCTSALQV